MSHGESYSLSIERVVGSLQDSSPLPRGPQSNIDEIFYRPSTYLLLTIIFLVAGYLFTYRVDPSAVSFSYSSIASKGAPYWRIITASFSHFDPLHLAFNTMSLYQLGSLVRTHLALTIWNKPRWLFSGSRLRISRISLSFHGHGVYYDADMCGNISCPDNTLWHDRCGASAWSGIFMVCPVFLSD